MGLGLSVEFEFYHRSDDVIFSLEGNISSLLKSGLRRHLLWCNTLVTTKLGVQPWWLGGRARLPIQCEEGVSYLGGLNPACIVETISFGHRPNH